MSAADLAIYAEIGLVCFLFAFLAVVAKVSLTKSASYQEVQSIPLHDALPEHTPQGSSAERAREERA
jgi:hypothetical protein